MIIVNGHLNITPPLSYYDKFYLFNFNITPKFKRDSKSLAKYYNNKNGYNGYYGSEGQFFIKYKLDGNGEEIGHFYDNYDAIVDSKNPPSDQPSTWCPLKPNVQGTKLIFDSSEYNRLYGWLKWLIKNFFKDKYKLNGDFNVLLDNKEINLSLKNNIITHRNKTIDNIQKKYKIKTNDEILNDLIDLTKNNRIKWIKDNHINKYVTSIKISNNIYIIVNLFIRDLNLNQNYINIYINKPDKLSFYKNVKGYKINELIKNVI